MNFIVRIRASFAAAFVAAAALPAISYADTVLPPSLSGFTVLDVNGGNLILNQGSVDGVVGLGLNSTASTLQKSTVTGELLFNNTAGHIATFDSSNFATDFHLLGNGGVPVGLDLTAAQQAANDLSHDFGVLVAPAGHTFALLNDDPAHDTLVGVAGQNVFAVGAVNFNSGTLTISGPANSSFIINITNGFDFSHADVLLTGGVTRGNVVFNFPGGDTSAVSIDVNKSDNTVFGIFLAPHRAIIFKDPTSIYDVQIFGQDITIHSGAQVNGPDLSETPPAPLPAPFLAGGVLLAGLAIAKKRGLRLASALR